MYDQAIVCFEKILEIDPKNVKAMTSKGYTYQKMEQFEKAIEVYSKVNMMNGGYNYESYNGLGTCFSKLRLFDNAIKFYNQIVLSEFGHKKLSAERSIKFLQKLKNKIGDKQDASDSDTIKKE